MTDLLALTMARHLGVREDRVEIHSMDESRPIGRLNSWSSLENLLAGRDLDVLVVLRPFRVGGGQELAFAIGCSEAYSVDELLASWVDPNVEVPRRRTDPVHWTPLCLAAQIPGDGCWIVESLLEARAALETEGTTALCCACRAVNVTVAALLISVRADVNRRNWRRDSPLLIAASIGSTPLVRLLLRNAADVSQEDNRGRGPIERSFEESWIDPAVSLVLAGATVRPYTDKCHLLHAASERGSHRWVTCLVRARASFQVRDELGRLPLDVALRGSGFLRRVQFRRCLRAVQRSLAGRRGGPRRRRGRGPRARRRWSWWSPRCR